MVDYDAVFSAMEDKPTNLVETGSKLVGKETPDKVTMHEDKVAEHYYDVARYVTAGITEDETLADKRQIDVRPMFDSAFDLQIAKSKLEAANVGELLGKAEQFVVETDEEAKQGVSMAMQSRKMRNAIEKSRKEIVRPHLDFQKAVKKYADDFTKCLKEMETKLLDKVEKYQDARKDTLRKAKVDDSSLDEISTDEGSSKTISEWTFTLEDISSVPVEYIQINERAIKAALKKGVREIPGLKIFEKKKKHYRVK